ncbi:MAG: hypothetical protein M3541_18390, partial [Acidobacteriota bacterium]|nr:hypothetical protein [Acidobacteriota bacterium]
TVLRCWRFALATSLDRGLHQQQPIRFWEGMSSTPSTMLNTAELIATAIASVTTAVSVKPGDLLRTRAA